jgi:TolB protein
MMRSAFFRAPLLAALALALAACQDADSDILGPSAESAAFAKGGNGGGGNGGGSAAVRIAFSVEGRDARIHTINPDGTDYATIPNTEQGTDPSWSPDRKKIAFAIPSGPDAGLYVIGTNGKRRTRLYAGPAGAPAWSRDGSRIAFHAHVGNGTHLFVVNANGTNLQQATAVGTANTHPSWSADGRIVFHSNRTAGVGLWVLSADGNQRTLALQCGYTCASPSWSPLPGDERIAYARHEQGTPQVSAIGFINADGTGGGTILYWTVHETADLKPDWSPDATQLVFNSAAMGGVRQLVVVNANGTEPYRVTTTSAYETAAAWSR